VARLGLRPNIYIWMVVNKFSFPFIQVLNAHNDFEVLELVC